MRPADSVTPTPQTVCQVAAAAASEAASHGEPLQSAPTDQRLNPPKITRCASVNLDVSQGFEPHVSQSYHSRNSESAAHFTAAAKAGIASLRNSAYTSVADNRGRIRARRCPRRATTRHAAAFSMTREAHRNRWPIAVAIEKSIRPQIEGGPDDSRRSSGLCRHATESHYHTVDARKTQTPSVNGL